MCHSSIISVAWEAQARRLQVQDQSGQVTEILAPYKESKGAGVAVNGATLGEHARGSGFNPQHW